MPPVGPFTFTLTGLYPRPTKEGKVLSHLHTRKLALEKVPNQVGERERVVAT